MNVIPKIVYIWCATPHLNLFIIVLWEIIKRKLKTNVTPTNNDDKRNSSGMMEIFNFNLYFDLIPLMNFIKARQSVKRIYKFILLTISVQRFKALRCANVKSTTVFDCHVFLDSRISANQLPINMKYLCECNQNTITLKFIIQGRRCQVFLKLNYKQGYQNFFGRCV